MVNISQAGGKGGRGSLSASSYHFRTRLDTTRPLIVLVARASMRRYVSGPVTVRRKGINRLCRDLRFAISVHAASAGNHEIIAESDFSRVHPLDVSLNRNARIELGKGEVDWSVGRSAGGIPGKETLDSIRSHEAGSAHGRVTSSHAPKTLRASRSGATRCSRAQSGVILLLPPS